MRSLPRMFQLLAVVAALLVPSFVFAEDPPADEAASKRGQAVLEAMTEAKEAYCGTTTLGLYGQGVLLGYMQVTLKKAAEDAEHAYEFSLEARIVMGPNVVTRHDTGTLDEAFGLLSLKGESVKAQGEAKDVKSYSLEVKDDAYHYTSKSGDADAATVKLEKDIDSVDGIEMLAVKAWIALPANEAHRFSLFDGEDGNVAETDVTASAPRKLGDRDVVQVSAKNLSKGQTTTYVCDATTGEILEATFEGAPFQIKPVSADDLKAWQDANK